MDDTEEIKRRIDIVDLVSSYLTLKKAGVNFRAMCPFHSEKTPSMMISPEKQIFHCFGCGEGGDIFTFTMKMENLNFREALEMLAARAGVKLKKQLPPKPGEAPDQKTRLFKINDFSAQVFHQILTKHPAGKTALEYLKKRKLTDQTIKDYLIGYAPSTPILKKFLKSKGFAETEIQKAGGPDRFYKRIIFPIRDVMGNVLGFTGRVLDPKQEPKYLNTPETPIFHKSRILFNLEKARGEIKLAKNTVVVEGQMDVISSYQAGVRNVVATSGTALTNEHLQILYRYTPNITFSFDSDTAGLTSAKKAYEMAIAEGFNVKMVELGEFKDPGEMIEKDSAEWKKVTENAAVVIDWYFDLAFKKLTTDNGQLTTELTSQQKKEIAKEILPLIKKIPDEIEKAHYVNLLSKKLDVGTDTIFSALEKITDKKIEGNLKPKVGNTGTSFKIKTEEILLGLLVLYPLEFEKNESKINEQDFSVDLNRKIYKELKKCYNKDKKTDLIATVLKNLNTDEKQTLNLIFLAVEEKYSNIDISNTIVELINHLRSDRKESLKKRFAKEIAQAESAGEREKLKKLIKEFQDAIK